MVSNGIHPSILTHELDDKKLFIYNKKSVHLNKY